MYKIIYEKKQDDDPRQPYMEFAETNATTSIATTLKQTKKHHGKQTALKSCTHKSRYKQLYSLLIDCSFCKLAERHYNEINSYQDIPSHEYSFHYIYHNEPKERDDMSNHKKFGTKREKKIVTTEDFIEAFVSGEARTPFRSFPKSKSISEVEKELNKFTKQRFRPF